MSAARGPSAKPPSTAPGQRERFTMRPNGTSPGRPYCRIGDYWPDPLAQLAAAEEAAVPSWREVVAEIRAEPLSHALVALAAVVFWTLLLGAPLLVMDWLL
ncbi:MAG TPA: hypothetical protein VM265_08070 [Sphingomicrobium sp.]|nr:hypothetical protein [Sphingomicrobium sp.]